MGDLYQHITIPLIVMAPVWCYILCSHRRDENYATYRRRIQWLSLSMGSFLGSVFPDMIDMPVFILTRAYDHDRGIFHSPIVFTGVSVFIVIYLFFDFFYMGRVHAHPSGEYSSGRHHWQDVIRRRMEDKALFFMGFILFWEIHLIMDYPPSLLMFRGG